MKKLFCLFTLLPLCLFCRENVFILSYSGSGSHLTMYGLTHLASTTWESPYPSSYYKNERFERFNRFFNLTSNTSFPHLYRIHTPVDYIIKRKDILDRDCSLVLILRNYRECFIHQMKNNIRVPSSNIIAKKKGLVVDKEYFDILDFYDNFNGKKTIVYYEDLKSNPRKYFSQIITFIDKNKTISNNDMDVFFESYNEHKTRVLDFYSLFIGTSVMQTKNVKPVYFSNSFWRTLDNKIEKTFPHLFYKYIQQYIRIPDQELGIGAPIARK